MKRYNLLFCFIIAVFISGGISLHAQRSMEKLDRGIVALKTAAGVYINWRIPSEEWYNVSYNIYRDGVKLNASPIIGASNYTDASGTITFTYTITSIKNGIESPHSKVATVINAAYLEIRMRDFPEDLHYELNDATAADLDGDGEYEIIVKRIAKGWTTTNTNYSFFEAYKLDGTFMWAINVGPNILPDVEINIAAFDFDGDGKAEVFMRTSEGTKFGNGIEIGDTDGDGITNYRFCVLDAANMQYMTQGPEFLSLIDGETGVEIDRVNFIPRGNASDWGDEYGHRCSKYFFGAPYLDGKKPSLFIGRGIYTKTIMRTYDVVGKKLVFKWEFNSEGTAYSYQGNHNYTIADVDEDGRDEITWGQMCVDDDGTGLYSTGMGHGDAMHVGDFDPYHKGQEVFSCLENSPVFGTLFREAATGKILHHYVTGSDCGRCCAGNITDAYKGAEIWGGGYGYSATDRTSLSHFGVAENYTIYWDGDLLKEICDHRNFSTSTGVGYGTITKFNGYGNISTLLAADAYSCNWSKGTPCLQADILGDWREEVIWRSTDNKALRIYLTPYETQHRIYTLMHDHQYRQAIAWQMCGYNQPPHVSYFLGDTYQVPPPAASTNGKFVWKGTTSDWDTVSTNWIYNDTLASFSNGKEVLFDVSGTDDSVNITKNLNPEIVTVSGPMDYIFTGSGSLTGNARLNKMGQGSLTLNGKHSYTGATEVWDGNLTINDSLTSSPIWLNRFASLAGKGPAALGITMEYGSSLMPGGNGAADTLYVGNSLMVKKGAILTMDLSKNPSSVATANQNDFIKINGNLVLETGLTLSINLIGDTIAEGDYILASISGSVTGAASNFSIKGIIGKKMELLFSGSDLILRITGVRDAASVIWEGSTNNVWDVSSTPNWLKNGSEDIFVYQDSVLFSDEATTKNINISGSPSPSNMKIDNTTSAIYTFNGTGDISGNGGLYKTNTGSAYINNRNSYTGKTIIDGGKLIVKYAPTSTNNGGIGDNSTDPTKLIISNGGTLQFTTANEITKRGLTLGTNGGILENASKLTWNGTITGTSLTKKGTGVLIIGANNSNLNQTTINTGTLYLETESAYNYGPGKKVIFNGGSLEMLNSTGSYSACNFALEVPSGISGTFIIDGRCEYNGALTGSGTLNLVTDYVRANLNANWSAFEGTINITPRGSGADLRINNSYGFAKATVTFGNNITAYHLISGTTVAIGELSGTASSKLIDGKWIVGAKNTSSTFNGIISGSSLTKVGTGTLTLTNANTYSGGTIINGGILRVSNTSGSATGSAFVTVNNEGALEGTSGSIIGGAVTINSGGDLRGLLTINGALIVNNGGSITPGSFFGTITVNNNLTMQPGGKMALDVISTSGYCDKLVIPGSYMLRLDGFLEITNNSTTDFADGNSFSIFYCNNISGSFDSIVPAKPGTGLLWDTTMLRTNGIIKVMTDPINKLPLISGDFQILLYPNPTSGKVRIKFNQLIRQGTLSIESINGINLEKRDIVSSQVVDIDLSAYPSGIYMLKMVIDGEKPKIFRLIKK